MKNVNDQFIKEGEMVLNHKQQKELYKLLKQTQIREIKSQIFDIVFYGVLIGLVTLAVLDLTGIVNIFGI